MFRARVIAGFLVVLLATSGIAQEHEHGEKLGVVHFATSCNPQAQKEFDRAVALLHSFQFSHAIEGFNATLKNDPACGIADWGIALSQWSNPFAPGMKDKGQLQRGQESAERGKAWEQRRSVNRHTSLGSAGCTATSRAHRSGHE